jgi:YD repeat-containing protein
MTGRFYALKLSILILVSLAFGFALAFLWVEREARLEQRPPSIALFDNDKDQDGLIGSVHQTRVETSKLLNKSGELVEGPRQLMELATYDQKGDRIESAHYLVSTSTYNGRQEYEYDDKGNLVGMTVRDANDSILSKETYRYEFDAVGNWTKMTTSKVVSEDGKESPRPDEVTYRSITYYFDKNIASAVEQNPARSTENETASEAGATSQSIEGAPEIFALLRRQLDEWIKANNSRDIDKELSFYGPKLLFYYRSRNVSRESVRKDKARMFERADLIDVRAGAPEITLDKDGKAATMSFRKQYVVKINGATRYGDVLQELRWQLTEDGWRIIGERDAQEIR